MASSEGQQAAPSVPHEHGVTKPRVIPPSHLVILREDELDCDLTTAIQRVREDQSTARSRILIVGPDDAEEKDTAKSEVLPMPRLPMSIGQVARSGALQALQSSGGRLGPKLESLEFLFDEAKNSIAEVVQASQEGMLARVHSRALVLQDVLGWLQANAEDLGREIAGLRDGCQEVDVFELLQEVQDQVETFFPEVRVNVAPPAGEAHCYGQAAALTEGLFLGIVLTVHRIGGQGAVNVEIGASGENLAIRILGLGEPVEVAALDETVRFREIIVDQHRGRIVPDALGPFGAGMQIELPKHP